MDTQLPSAPPCPSHTAGQSSESRRDCARLTDRETETQSPNASPSFGGRRVPRFQSATWGRGGLSWGRVSQSRWPRGHSGVGTWCGAQCRGARSCSPARWAESSDCWAESAWSRQAALAPLARAEEPGECPAVMSACWPACASSRLLGNQSLCRSHRAEHQDRQGAPPRAPQNTQHPRNHAPPAKP